MKKKAVTGIFFILSCFAAMFVLLEFHDNYLFVGIAAFVLLVSSFCFLNAVFAEKSKEWGALEEQEDAKGSSGRTGEEFKKKYNKLYGSYESQSDSNASRIKKSKANHNSPTEKFRKWNFFFSWQANVSNKDCCKI